MSKDDANVVGYIIKTWCDVREIIQYIVFVTKYITPTIQNNLTWDEIDITVDQNLCVYIMWCTLLILEIC